MDFNTTIHREALIGRNSGSAELTWLLEKAAMGTCASSVARLRAKVDALAFEDRFTASAPRNPLLDHVRPEDGASKAKARRRRRRAKQRALARLADDPLEVHAPWIPPLCDIVFYYV